jgi:hypothetical protein
MVVWCWVFSGFFLIYSSGRKKEKNVSRTRKKTFYKQNMEIINQPVKIPKVKINQTFVWVLPKSFKKIRGTMFSIANLFPGLSKQYRITIIIIITTELNILDLKSRSLNRKTT